MLRNNCRPWSRLSRLILAGVLALAPALAIADAPTPTLDAALKSAAERRAPVLIDFHAPWCYSCYYMSRHVLTGPRWQAVERDTVVVEIDADSPEGAQLMQRWGVKALPSYLVLDARGEELGRILAEQRQDEFFQQLGGILKRATGFDDLKARAAAAKPDVSAAREVLQRYHARYDAAGLDWYAALRAPLRKAYDADSPITLWRARLELLRASKAKDAAACAAVAPAVFAGDLGCQRPYELSRVSACIASLPPSQREPLLAAQLPAMQTLVQQRVLARADHAKICADRRSAVLGLSDLYREIGRKADSDAVLRKAVQAVAAGRTPGADRNADDDWRTYLEALDDRAMLDALYPRLIEAYPDDYVYAFRYGRNLLARGEAQKALPYLEQAAERAYGQNRLKVAEQRVKALQALGRGDEAKRVAGDALKVNGPWFPEDAARLKALL